MATLFVDKIDPQSGTSLEIGSSGDTFALGSGVVQSNLMYPAFKSYMSANQTLSDNTWTKINFDTEAFDTDSMYDTSTYRFTPTVAGKYFVYSVILFESLTATRIEYANASIYKNGSSEIRTTAVYSADNVSWQAGGVISTVVEFNGSSDYVESYGRIKTFSGSNKIASSDSTYSVFGAYRIGS